MVFRGVKPYDFMGLHWKFEKKKAGDWSKLMENGMFANENIGLMEFN